MRARDGDHDAADWFDLRAVVVEHHREIFRFARTFTFNDADAEDLAQTAVLRALQRGEIVSDPVRAKAYVMRIVRNLATDQARSRARHAVEPWAELPDLPSEVASDDADDWADEAAASRAAFADLPDVHREVLRLRFFDELGYDVVAQRLRTTEHGARQRVYRAMQALRALVKSGKYRQT